MTLSMRGFAVSLPKTLSVQLNHSRQKNCNANDSPIVFLLRAFCAHVDVLHHTLSPDAENPDAYTPGYC